MLAHFPPADTYCSKADVKDIVYGTKNFKTKDKSNESMLLFGFGDGGGGPTPQMLEALRRVTPGVDGLPNVSIRGPTEFFDRVKAASKQTELPVRYMLNRFSRAVTLELNFIIILRSGNMNSTSSSIVELTLLTRVTSLATASLSSC